MNAPNPDYVQIPVHGRHLRWAAHDCRQAGVPVVAVQPAGPQIYLIIVPAPAAPQLAAAPWIHRDAPPPRRRLALPGPGWIAALALLLAAAGLIAWLAAAGPAAAAAAQPGPLAALQHSAEAILRTLSGILMGAGLIVICGPLAWLTLRLRPWRWIR